MLAKVRRGKKKEDDPYARLNDCTQWRGWQPTQGMGTTEVLLETELTTKGYANKIVAPKEDWKKRREEQQAERIKAKKAEREALKNKSALEGMTDEEKARELGLGVEMETPFWKFDSHKRPGVIVFNKRKGRCPAFVPEKKESAFSSLMTNEKTKNFNADMSAKTKGARGKQKAQFASELEYHEQQWKRTHSSKYVRHYYELDRTDLKFGKSRGSLDIFEAGWRGRGIGPLNVHNHVFHPKGRVVIDEGSHVWRPKDALELAMEKAGAVKNY
jgi:hypothetical protein